MHLHFKIKFCGIMTVEDALLAIAAGADAIGLNFVESSPRCIDVATAKRIREAVGDRCQVIGVIANLPSNKAVELASVCGLSLLQLHGQETAEAYGGDLPVGILRSIAWQGGERGESETIRAWLRIQNLSGFLIDAHDPTRLGGTGKTVAWDSLARSSSVFGGKPWVLAGGLTPVNVCHAIETAKPMAVDTASGIEVRPGVKDAAAMREFVREAHRGWGANP